MMCTDKVFLCGTHCQVEMEHGNEKVVLPLNQKKESDPQVQNILSVAVCGADVTHTLGFIIWSICERIFDVNMIQCQFFKQI